jgi:hypothetical protein
VTEPTKLTVNLTPRAISAMKMGAVLTGDTRTDTVNRALQVYAFLMEQMHLNGRRLFLAEDDGVTLVQEVEFK